MPRVSPIQSNFNSGEFSPLMQGRVDAERYKSGLGTCFNAIPTLQGPVSRRSGSPFVAPTKTVPDTEVIIPFKYSNLQAYILEFGDGFVRFVTDRQQLLIAPNTPYEIPTFYTKEMLPGLKYAQSLDVLYLFHPSLPPMQLKRYGALDWVMEFIPLQDGPYFNVGLDPRVSKVTSQIHSASINVSGVTGSITATTKAGDYAAYGITAIVNNGSGECRITLPDDNEFGNRSRVFISGATGTTGANGTFVANQINATQYDLIGSVFNAVYTGGAQICPAPFLPLDSNSRHLRVKFAGTAWGWGQITAYTNGATVTVTVLKSLGAGAGTTPEFRLGLYSPANGYPSCGTFHDDRLYMAGCPAALQRLDGSVVSDYDNFSPCAVLNPDGSANTLATVVASDAVSFTINSNDANKIQWLTSDEYGMPVGTQGGPFVLRASSLNVAITPDNVSCKRVDSVGAADLMPVYAGKSTLYLSLSKRKLYELTYYYNIDGFRRVDLTEIAHNLPDIGIATNLVFQSSPQPILWCARADGTLLAVTFDRNLDVLRTGWSRHKLGGVSDSAGNPPIIESMAVIPSPDGSEDDVWFIVRRYVNGQTVRNIEYFSKIFEEFDQFEDAFMVDSGATYDVPVTVSGISSASPAVVHAVGHGLATGNKVKFKGVEGLKSNTGVDLINGILFTTTVLDVDHFSLDGFDSTFLTAYLSGGEVRKAVTTISGITWLEGETVSILGDAEILDDAVVTGGSITLSKDSTVVQFGLKYKTQIQQLRLEAGAADGASLGKNRRINEAAVLVDRSYDYKIGVDFDNMTPVDVSNNEDDYGHAGLFTGILVSQVESNYDYENQLAFEIDTPTPFTLCAIMPHKKTYDKG